MQKVLADYLSKYKPMIDERLAFELAKRKKEVGDIAPQLSEIVSYMEELSVGGKRMRAILTLIGYEIAGKPVDSEVVKAAVAMEIFQLGLLIHDDVMDQDNLRRGVPTIHARFADKHLGESLAICAGDYAFAWTSDILTSLKLPARSILAGLSVWNRYYRRVGYGQTLDVWTESRGASEDEIMQVIMLKSGEYSCVLPLLLGATLANGTSGVLSNLEKYALELGWVFHLRDDYLAEYGESAKTGKPVGNDSREGKKTIVTIYGKARTLELIDKHLEAGKKLFYEPRLKAIIEFMAERDN